MLENAKLFARGIISLITGQYRHIFVLYAIESNIRVNIRYTFISTVSTNVRLSSGRQAERESHDGQMNYPRECYWNDWLII